MGTEVLPVSLARRAGWLTRTGKRSRCTYRLRQAVETLPPMEAAALLGELREPSALLSAVATPGGLIAPRRRCTARVYSTAPLMYRRERRPGVSP